MPPACFYVFISYSASGFAGLADFLWNSADLGSDSAVAFCFWQPSKCTSYIEVTTILSYFFLFYTYL